MEFKDKIQTLMVSKKMTQREFAILVGVDETLISRRFSRKPQKPQMTTLRKIADVCGCNLDWLTTGDGESFLKSRSQTPISFYVPESTSSDISRHGDMLDNDFTLVPKYRARLSGGHGSFETSDMIEANMAFRTEFLLRNGNPNRMALFELMGDSMTPFIHHGDVILVDLQQDDPAAIVDGKAYAFREDHTVKVKRLSVQGRNLIATSEDSRQYPPYQIDESSFTPIGRVIWVGHEVR